VSYVLSSVVLSCFVAYGRIDRSLITGVLYGDRAMVWDHMKWAIGKIGLVGVSVLLTVFYTVCCGCGVLRLSDLPLNTLTF